jgi:hypothetical protein
VFTLENQQTGETGFALACGDSRIGAVLAVAEAGNYDYDNPFLGIFYSCLEGYIENTISVYNGITQTDIENALNRASEARATAPYVPVTDVGKDPAGLQPIPDKGKLLDTVRWRQGAPYNKVINDVKQPPSGYYYVTGCGPTAIAQIMAYYGKPERPTLPQAIALAQKYGFDTYDWKTMRVVDANIGLYPKAEEAIGVLMYEIGVYTKATYNMGPIDSAVNPKEKGKAETGIVRTDDKIAFKNMGYYDPGDFIKYSFSWVQNPIDDNKPVIVAGHSAYETKTYIFGITNTTYKNGHQWVIDGYWEMTTKVKDKVTGQMITDYPLKYVHCNLGWGPYVNNGWYIDGVFNTNDIPETTRSSTPYFYQWNIQILPVIIPK